MPTKVKLLLNRTRRNPQGGDEQPDFKVTACPSCGRPITSTSTAGETLTHNPVTCRLVNIALKEMSVVLEHPIRVEIYPGTGPLGGFYATTDPYTIHISDDAYTRFPEYIIFHETKHLVDCLTKGWSEEGTPDPFARSLCVRHGYRWPPPQYPITFSGAFSWGQAYPAPRP